MARTSHQNMDFQCARLCHAGTRWRQSNGFSALSSRRSHSPVTIKPWITRTGKGEGTSANLLRSHRCKSKRKSQGRLRARPFRQILMFAFAELPGQATVKLQKSNSARMEDQLGKRRPCSGNQNQMPGGFGNSIGKRQLRQENKR